MVTNQAAGHPEIPHGLYCYNTQTNVPCPHWQAMPYGARCNLLKAESIKHTSLPDLIWDGMKECGINEVPLPILQT